LSAQTHYAAPEHWTPIKLPATNQIGDLSIALLSLSTTDNSQVHLRLAPATDWQIVEGRMTDEEGNSFSRYTTRADRGEAALAAITLLNPTAFGRLRSNWCKRTTIPLPRTSMFRTAI
jgi:hypothetical protein